MAMKADVAVIGAGAFGLSVALHCALRGRSVAVVERETAGSQASRRAAGLFKSVQGDALSTSLARHSMAKVLSFEDWAGVPLDVRRSGSLLIARTGQHKAILREEADRSRSWGVELTETDLADRVGYYQPAGSELALWCPEDIYIEEPASLIQAYLAACRLREVEILEREPAVRMLTSGGRVTGVETTGNGIEASVVVDAAGAWVRQVAEMARGPFPRCKVAVAPFRHQLLITEPASAVRESDPIVRVIDAAVYLRPARSGLMFGCFEADPMPLDPRLQHDSFSTDEVPLDLESLRKRAELVAGEVPLASLGPVADLRGGLLTMTPDGRFVAGPITDVPGLWVTSGCNGSGFSFSPAIGEALANWIIDGEPSARLAPLAPDRFGPVTDDGLLRDGAWQYTHFYDRTQPIPGLTTLGLSAIEGQQSSFKGEGTGAVRHMFSHHILKPERTPLEAHPWGTPASSGSFSTLFQSRILRAQSYKREPTDQVLIAGRVERTSGLSLPTDARVIDSWRHGGPATGEVYLSTGDSSRTDLPDASVDLIVTDPPYMDNVHYSELADFFHAWLRELRPYSAYPLTAFSTRSSAEVQNASPSEFEGAISGVWKECARILKPTGLMAFTFHQARISGWKALMRALTQAGLIVTAVQPVQGEMATSVTKGGVEPSNLDSVIICRRVLCGFDRVSRNPRQAAEIAEGRLLALRRSGVTVGAGDVRSVIRGQVLAIYTAEPEACDLDSLASAADELVAESITRVLADQL